MHLVFIILIISLLFSCNSKNNSWQSKHAQIVDSTVNNSAESENEVAYVSNMNVYYKDQVSTVELKGGYKIYYTRNKNYKSIYLRHGLVSKKLNTLPLNEGSYHMLGIVLNDFDDCFILGHDNGNSVPYTVELIEKKTTKNMLEHEVYSIEGKYNEDNLIYYDITTERLKEKVVLFNLRSYLDFIQKRRTFLEEKSM